MSAVLESAGLALFGCWVVAQVVAPGRKRLHSGIAASAYACLAVFDFLDRDPAGGVFLAVICGIFLWLWWHDGRGDDTKRRLRGLARAFTPTRRSAPVTA